jgi:aryl-alcohol dehydrogenase-like predicted oxidoreductase
MEAFDKRNANIVTWEVIGAVEDIAKVRGITMAQVALAWVAAQPAVTSVILGARTTEQLKDNLGAASVVLTHEDIAKLSAVSKPDMSDYPYGEGGVGQRNRKLEGGR